MDDGQVKAQVLEAALAFMEVGNIFKLAVHKTCETDCGLWKLLKEWQVNGGGTKVSVLKCLIFSQFG